MDPEIAKIIETALTSVAVAAAAVGIARYVYLSARHNNETYASRMEGDGKKVEIIVAAIKNLFAQPDYLRFLEQRAETANRLLGAHPNLYDDREGLEELLDTMGGRVPHENVHLYPDGEMRIN